MPDRAKLKEHADILEQEWMRAYVDSPERGFYYTGAHIADYYYKTDRHYENVLSVVFPVIRYGNCLGYIIVDLDFLKMNEIVNGGIKRVNFSIL